MSGSVRTRLASCCWRNGKCNDELLVRLLLLGLPRCKNLWYFFFVSLAHARLWLLLNGFLALLFSLLLHHLWVCEVITLQMIHCYYNIIIITIIIIIYYNEYFYRFIDNCHYYYYYCDYGNVTIEFMFAGINMFWVRLRLILARASRLKILHFSPQNAPQCPTKW